MDRVVSRLLQFDRFALDLMRGCARVGGRDIDLPPKAFDVLRVLAENAGRLVSKQELYNAVWPGVTVTDDSLVQRIRELRQALGDDDHNLIKTVSRRGYLLDTTPQQRSEELASKAAAGPRFVAEVKEGRAPLGVIEVADAALSEPGEPKPEQSAPGSPEPRQPTIVACDLRDVPTVQATVDPARRQVTAMVCGFGAETLAGRLEPEDLREILGECRKLTRETAEAHGGLLVKTFTEGMEFLFGYPQACEDDAERAVRAALAANKVIREIKFEHLLQPLQGRAGIATGVVMITGMDLGDGLSVVGEAPLLASSLFGLARPGTVVIAESTRRLVGTLFAFRDLAAVDINIEHFRSAFRKCCVKACLEVGLTLCAPTLPSSLAAMKN